ncbi:serine hydrolase [Streptosporangiaceae bacterium NEAU-GS5]|nr:serine hydrolase [Streptosporangiaceae bacterium NEAU-GS5]
MDIDQRMRDLLESGRASGLHGLVVLSAGRPVVEHYGQGPDFSWGVPHGEVAFGPGTLHDVRSVTKSVVGLLYGMALADGLVPEPAEPLMAQFPEYPDLAADPQRAALTVEHALTMTLGLEWREDIPYTSPENSEIAMELAPDRHRYVLERPIVEPPGRTWSYCGGAAALIGRLIVKGSGRTLPEFAEERLFAPLGIDQFAWMAGDDGVHSAASGLRLTPRGLAAIGQAVLEGMQEGGLSGGLEGGRGVVPAGWLREALTLRVPIDGDFGYGYQWYVLRGQWVGAMGNGGQRLIVIPEHDLVVAITAGAYDDADQAALPQMILNELVLSG